MSWLDLSDSEIKRRLIQRGVHIEHAVLLVNQRDDPKAIEEITRILKP